MAAGGQHLPAAILLEMGDGRPERHKRQPGNARITQVDTMTSMVEPGIYLMVAAVLFWAAATDIKDRRIPNIQPLSILGLFGVLALWQVGRGDNIADALAWPVLAGVLVFGFCLVLFALNLMGGGDVKLMAAVALVAGPALSPSFVVFVTLAGGIVAVCTLVHTYAQTTSNNQAMTAPQVPYGVAIMAGGLWVCLQKISVTSA